MSETAALTAVPPAALAGSAAVLVPLDGDRDPPRGGRPCWLRWDAWRVEGRCRLRSDRPCNEAARTTATAKSR
jgi:hypothetical protein